MWVWFPVFRNKGQFCTELVSWEDEACPLSRNKKERSWEIAFTPHSSPDGGFTAEVRVYGHKAIFRCN